MGPRRPPEVGPEFQGAADGCRPRAHASRSAAGSDKQAPGFSGLLVCGLFKVCM